MTTRSQIRDRTHPPRAATFRHEDMFTGAWRKRESGDDEKTGT